MALTKEYLKEQIDTCKKSLKSIEEGKFINENLLVILEGEYAQISNNKGN